MQKKTLVIGASENVERYSNMAIKKLVQHQHPVVAIGVKSGSVQGVPIGTTKEAFENIDTVTLYINPAAQAAYYDYLLQLKPKRIIFNPGTENDVLFNLAKEQGIEPIEACTLVMLSTGQY